MQHKLIHYILLLLTAASIACSGDPERGILALNISSSEGDSSVRTASAGTGTVVESFVVYGMGPGGQTFRRVTPEGKLEVTGLVPGPWQVNVEALNETGDPVEGTSQNVTVIKKEVAESLLITKKYESYGSLDLEITWNEPVANPRLKALLIRRGGVPLYVDFEIVSPTKAVATLERPVGVYTLMAYFYDSRGNLANDELDLKTSIGGAAQVMQVSPDLTTAVSMSIIPGDIPEYGDLNVTINVDMKNPVNVTLEGLTDHLVEGADMTVTAASPGEAEAVEYTWFIDGEYASEGDSFTVGSILTPGMHNLDVVAFNPDSSRGGSTGFTFKVYNLNNIIPSKLKASVISHDTIDISWRDNAPNEDGFKIERSSDGINFTEIATVSTNITTYRDTGLDEYTTYLYRVRAFNNTPENSGYSLTDYSMNVTATTFRSIPIQPSDAVIASPVFHTVQMTWTDNAFNEYGYRITRSIDGVNYQIVAELDAGTVEYEDTELTAGTDYWYSLVAFNSGGASEPVVLNVTTLRDIPFMPENLTARSPLHTTVVLSWQDAAFDEEIYIVERSENGIQYSVLKNDLAAGSTGYTDTTCSENKEYWYRVKAKNNGGSSDYAVVNVTSLKSKPINPSGLTVDCNYYNKVNLAWTDNSYNEEGFKIFRSTDGSNFTLTATVDPDTVAFTDTGLSENTHYDYRVLAFNNGGESEYLSDSVTTLKAMPLAPENLVAVSPEYSRMNLTWSDIAYNEEEYIVERSTDGILYTEEAVLPPGTTLFEDTGLTEHTKYWYRVTARNNGGTSAAAETSATTLYMEPIAQTGLGAAAPGQGTITLTWSDNSYNEEGFKIERSADGENFSQIAVTNSNIETYSNTGLTPDTQYHYRVFAFNNGGEAYYSEITATTLKTVPAAPTELTLTCNSKDTVSLSWTDNAVNEEGFRIERSTDGAVFAAVNTLGPGVTSCSDSGLNADTAYWYRVTAYNNGGEASTSIKSVTTLKSIPHTPENFSAVSISESQVNLSWDDIAFNEEGYILERSNDGGGTFTPLATLSPDTTSYSDTERTENYRYDYRIRAFNNGGESSMVTVFVTTLRSFPLAPTELYATASTSTKVMVTWSDHAFNEVGYHIERSTDGETYVELAQLDADADQYYDTAAIEDTTHYYRVFAVNSRGESTKVTATVQTQPSARYDISNFGETCYE